MSVDLAVDLTVRVVEKFSDLIKKRPFKKGKIRLIVDRSRTEIERRETVIEGMWDTWVKHPPGLFLKDVEVYDLVEPAKRQYTVKEATSEYSGKTERINVQKKGTMFVSAQSILFIEFYPSP